MRFKIFAILTGVIIFQFPPFAGNANAVSQGTQTSVFGTPPAIPQNDAVIDDAQMAEWARTQAASRDSTASAMIAALIDARVRSQMEKSEDSAANGGTSVPTPTQEIIIEDEAVVSESSCARAMNLFTNQMAYCGNCSRYTGNDLIGLGAIIGRPFPAIAVCEKPDGEYWFTAYKSVCDGFPDDISELPRNATAVPNAAQNCWTWKCNAGYQLSTDKKTCNLIPQSNSTPVVTPTPTAGSSEQPDDTAKITAEIERSAEGIANIEAKYADLNASKWRTTTGGFNTARLASDAIAGSVLGIAGGLITHSIIKKNQTKSGFEDIKCSIAGQQMADFGDNFMVTQ